MSHLPKTPNFILFMTDQQRSIQYFPADWVKKHLPNYQTFLDKGAVFQENICNSSPCGPSRASIFSGMFPANNGVTNNNGTITPAQMNFANVLNSVGYDVHYMGKLHMRDEFTEFSNNWPQNLETAAMSAFDQNALLHNYYGMKSWTSPDFGTNLVQGTDLSQSDLASLAGGIMGNDERVITGKGNVNKQTPNVLGLIEKLQSKSAEQAFCLVVSLLNPHDISLFPFGYQQAGYDMDAVFDELELSQITLPPSYAGDNLSTKPTVQASYLNTFCKGGLNEEMATRYLQFYAYLHTLSDQLLGSVMDKLSDDLLKDTILIRMADHGEMGMSHCGLEEKNFSMYNEMIQVPMIWMHEGIPAGPRTQMVSLIDLVPTLGTLAGADLSKFPALQGEDYSAVLLDSAADFRDHSLFNYNYSPPPNTPSAPVQYPGSTLYNPPQSAPAKQTSPANYPNNIYAYVSPDYKFAVYYALDSNNYVDWSQAQFECYKRSDTNELNNLFPPPAASGTPSKSNPADIEKHYVLLTKLMEKAKIILPLGWKAFDTKLIYASGSTDRYES